ncbi:MAG: T9SS type A sorting domain-containing protein, partial [Bacteroidota bacterium]
TGHIYTTDAGKTNYVWSVTGGTITSGGGSSDNTATVTWTSTGSQHIDVSYTDGCGSAPKSLPVTVNVVPSPTLSGPATVCLNSAGNVYTTEPGMSDYSWTIDGGTITSGGGITDRTATVTWTTSGARSISVNYTEGGSFVAGGCSAPTATSYPVTVNPLPVPSVTGPASVCIGSAGNVYTTEAGMTNYVWIVSAGGSITAGGTSPSNTVTVTWNTAGAQEVSVNYTNGNSCTAASLTSFNVAVHALPVPAISGPANVCMNATGNIYSTATGKSNYTWTVSSGGSVTSGGTSSSNTVTVTWTTAGAQTVSVNYTDENGCMATTATVFDVTVGATPAPTISGPTPVCINSTGNLYSTEPGKTNYIWSVTGGTITSGGGTSDHTATVTWTASGSKNISVSYENSGCTPGSPTVYGVTVDPLPVPSVSGPATACDHSSGNVYSSEPGMTGYVWTVSSGGSVTSGGTGTSNSVTVTWNTPGAQTVSVSYVNGNGCSAVNPTVFNVTVNPLPLPALSGPTPVCVNATGNVYTTDPGMSNYTWTVSSGGSITAGGTSSSNTVTVQWNTDGAQTVSVNYSDGNGCAAAVSSLFDVTVNPLPVPVITGPANVCLNSTGNVYSTQTGMTNYLWTISGGSITSGGGTGNNTATVTWNVAGSKSISVNYTNGNGCTAASPATYDVTVNTLPVPVITGPASVCVNSTGNTYSTASGNTNYSWTVSAGGSVTAGGTGSDNTVTVTWTTSGSNTVTVNYSNAAGCTAASATSYGVVVNALPAPTISGPAQVCVNSSGVTYSTQAGMSGYSWTVSSGGSITGGVGTRIITVAWTTTGSKTVTVNYTNANGCSAVTPTVKNVTVVPLPVPVITGIITPCVNTTGVVYTTAAGMAGYSWDVSAGGTITDGGTAASNSVTVTWDVAGAQTVSVNYYNGNGCTAISPTVLPVSVKPLPEPTLTGSTQECLGAIGVTYTTEAGMLGYDWSLSAGTITAGGTPSSNFITVTWDVVGAQTVSVNYTNAYGCNISSPTVLAVNVSQALSPHINGYSAIYAGTAGVDYSATAGMSTYSWTVTGGTITSGQGTSNIVVSWGSYPVCGCGNVSVDVTNNGCSGTANFPIQILPPSNVNIFGLISYDNSANTKMNGVKVKLYDSLHLVIDSTVTAYNPITSTGGYYAFSNIPNGTYTIHPVFAGPWGGNNATDALIVQLNAINSYPLSGLPAYVADVNGSLSITALDALYIKLRTVGMIGSYPAGDWKSGDTVVTLAGSPLSINIKTLCYGDVNASFIPVGMKEVNSLSVVEDGIITIPVNEPFVYDIHSTKVADLGAMTLFMGYDQDRFEVIDIASKLDGMKYVIGDGKISIAWANTKPMKVSSGDLILSLNMKVKQKIDLPERVFSIMTGSEFADILAAPYDNFDLKMADMVTSGGSKEITLFNYPNPFSKKTTIYYTLPEAGNARLVLTDLYGNTVRTLVDKPNAAGAHTVTVDPAELNMASGVYMYKLIFDSSTDTYMKVNKMVLTK